MGRAKRSDWHDLVVKLIDQLTALADDENMRRELTEAKGALTADAASDDLMLIANILRTEIYVRPKPNPQRITWAIAGIAAVGSLLSGGSAAYMAYQSAQHTGEQVVNYITIEQGGQANIVSGDLNITLDDVTTTSPAPTPAPQSVPLDPAEIKVDPQPQGMAHRAAISDRIGISDEVRDIQSSDDFSFNDGDAPEDDQPSNNAAGSSGVGFQTGSSVEERRAAQQAYDEAHPDAESLRYDAPVPYDAPVTYDGTLESEQVVEPPTVEAPSNPFPPQGISRTPEGFVRVGEQRVSDLDPETIQAGKDFVDEQLDTDED